MYKITKKELVDTISIPIMSLCRGVTLVHKVRLSRPDLNGKRDYFHKEFNYPSKYQNPARVTTLRLTHSSILAIENKSDDGYESLIINITNRDFIRKSLSRCKKILKLPDLFIENDDTYIVNPKLRQDTVISFNPYKDKIVVAKPCVITYEDGNSIGGIALNLDSRNSSFIEIEGDTFKTFLRFIKKFDFHVAGLAAIAYLQSAEIGNHEIDVGQTNVLDFDVDLAPEYKLSKNKSIKGLEVRRGEPIQKNKGW